ncbi:MAG: hypothetical protein GYB66_03210 [Chloroflexi bacterium]|nr:hypothetical protein [Chloroflexota bacterium]
MDGTQDFANLFTDSTGELLYFIAIFVLYQAALLIALDQRQRSDNERAAGRYVVSLAVAEFAWLALMGGALYGVITDDEANLMPPLEHTVNAIVLVGLSWGLITAEYDGKPRELTLFGVVITLVLLAGFAYTLRAWDPDQDFNTQSYAVSWIFVPVVLSGLGILLLLTRYRFVADIPLKLVFFAVFLAGHAFTLVQLAADELDGDAAGAVRWAFMTGSALAIVMVYRMVIDRMTSAVEEVATYAEHISRPLKAINLEPRGAEQQPEEIARLSTEVKSVTAGTGALGGRNEAMELIKALGIMLDKEETEALPGQIVRAVAEAIKADIAAVVAYDDANWADILAAYDYSNKQPISGMSLNLGEQVTLLDAIQSRRQRKLDVTTHAEELKDLYTRLDIMQTGPTYFQPLTRQGKAVGVLIVGLPYVRRELRPEEGRLLESVGPIAARLLVISRTAMMTRIQAEERAILQIVENAELPEDVIEDSTVLAMRREMQENLNEAQQEINELNRHIQHLQRDLAEERERIRLLFGEGRSEDDDEAMSITQRIQTISVERESLQEERTKLSAALKEARATLAGAVADDETELYHTMIESMKQEISDLRSQKARLETQLNEIRAGEVGDTAINQMRDMLNSLIEEKRQVAIEKDALSGELVEARQNLEALGIEGGVEHLTQQITQLTEERNRYKAQADKLMGDREMLLAERRKLEEAITQEKAREEKIAALEEEISRLIQDREAFTKGRDSLKAEREALLAERDNWYSERARMLAHNDSLRMERDEVLEMLNEVNHERQELSTERNQLAADRDRSRVELKRLENERDALLARVEGDRDRLQELGSEGVESMTSMIDDLTRERLELEEKLLVAEQTIEQLQRELNHRRASTDSEEVQVEQRQHAVNMEVIISLAQELRTPLSVIIGYTDTVLNESVGILGALQRKLLTRVKANVDRLIYLVEELVQVVAVDSGDLKLKPQRVNLVDVIDDALTASRYKFSEKGIVLDLDIEHDTLDVQADLEALRQIMNHLIQNAYLVSPTDGSVHVSAQLLPEIQVSGDDSGPATYNNVVYVQVRDQGGGISPEDQQRVFSRLYRADNPLIEGLGDTGVGMSITKAMVEAHGGKIWLESTAGVGNTFKVVLPVDHPFNDYVSSPPEVSEDSQPEPVTED